MGDWSKLTVGGWSGLVLAVGNWSKLTVGGWSGLALAVGDCLD